MDQLMGYFNHIPDMVRCLGVTGCILNAQGFCGQQEFVNVLFGKFLQGEAGLACTIESPGSAASFEKCATGEAYGFWVATRWRP